MKAFLVTITIAFSIINLVQLNDLKEEVITKIAFGSKYYTQNRDSFDIFQVVKKHNPQIWVWLGDAIQIAQKTLLSSFKQTPSIDWNKVTKMYNELKNSENYGAIHKNSYVIGTWNDLDYGSSNGDWNNAEKEKSKKEFLDFIEAPNEDQRRTVGRGLYTTHVFGSGFKSIRFIILDIRYKKQGHFDGDMLGEDQWEWLENVLKISKETFTFIISPTQVLPFNRFYTESWFRESRKRLFGLIGKYKKNGTMFLSGDVGFAQILKTFCVMPEIGYDLYEITSSGLSSSLNQNYLFEKILPNDYNYGKTFQKMNFGEININWGNNINETKLDIAIYDANDEKKLSLELAYNDLVATSENIFDSEEKIIRCSSKINNRFKSPMKFIKYYQNHTNEALIGVGFVVLALLIVYILSEIKKPFIQITIAVIVLVAGILLAKYEMDQKQKFDAFLKSIN